VYRRRGSSRVSIGDSIVAAAIVDQSAMGCNCARYGKPPAQVGTGYPCGRRSRAHQVQDYPTDLQRRSSRMIGTLAGHCGIVTAATTPVGRAVALELARDCARVAIGYRGCRGVDLEAAEEIMRDVVCLGGEALPLRVSVVTPEMECALAALAAFWGRIDFVVDLDPDSVVSRASLPLMLERRRGRVLAVGPVRASSLAYDRPQLRHFAERGVAVNYVATAVIETEPCSDGPQTGPDGRTCVGTSARAEDVAATVYFLLTQGGCITGQLLDLSGVRKDAPLTFSPPIWSRWNAQLLQRLGPEVGSRTN
jgi:hypothetical protein